MFKGFSKDAVLDVVIPRYCFVCGRPNPGPSLKYVCEICFQQMELIDSRSCVRCGFPFIGFISSERTCPTCLDDPPETDASKALLFHRGTSALFVQELKYHRGRYLMDDIEYLAAKRSDLCNYFEGTTLIPIPLHPRKQRERGYNQSEWIAEAIARVFRCSVDSKLLEKCRDNRTQTLLSRGERKKNVRSAYRIKDGRAVDLKADYVLVDDVYTTGSTLSEAAKILRKAGLNRVKSFTLAHG